MKERVLELLSQRERYDIDVAKDFGNDRIGITRYMDAIVNCNDETVCIDGLGEYSFADHQFDIVHFNFITIKKKDAVGGDSVTIM
jgi:hypothetical protein